MSDLHHRITGVSASIRALIPGMSERFDVFFVAKKNQGDVPAQTLKELFRLLRRWPETELPPLWHVRRNNEMTWGLLFRRFVNPRLKLVFTNSAIRKHSAWPRWLISKMDAIMVTSNAGLVHLPTAVSVVPHGVDIDHFSQIDESFETPWRKYDCVIGIVGRIRPEKGTDLFSAAICDVLVNHPSACAVLVGKTTSKYRSFLESLKNDWEAAGISSRVFLLDEVPLQSMPAVYANLDIVCAPARYEGYGLVPLEAMVSGTAVIASRTGAYEDMIVPGENGSLVNCGSEFELSIALEGLVSDPDLVSSFKAEGARKVRSNFSIEREIEGMSDVYQSLWQVSS